MNIIYAYDVDFPNRFAASIQIIRTGSALAEIGHDFELVCGRNLVESAEIFADLGIETPAGVRLRPDFPPWPRSPVLRDVVLRRRISAIVAGERPEILMSRGETGIALGRSRRSGPTRRILEVHKLRCLEEVERIAGVRVDPDDARRALSFNAEARAFRHADGLLYLTPGVRDVAEAAFGQMDVPAAIAPSGTASPMLANRGADARAETEHDLIYFGKIERRKGLFLMLETMRRLPGRSLHLIGGGSDMQAAGDFVEKHGLEARVRFAGPVPHARIADELSRARVGLCLLPDDVDHVSAVFTSPMKLLEMMAAGLPVVATDIASIRNICRHEVDALLAPPDPVAIAATIERLLTDPVLVARVGDAARRRATDFSWRARARRISTLCDEVLQSPEALPA